MTACAGASHSRGGCSKDRVGARGRRGQLWLLSMLLMGCASGPAPAASPAASAPAPEETWAPGTYAPPTHTGEACTDLALAATPPAWRIDVRYTLPDAAAAAEPAQVWVEPTRSDELRPLLQGLAAAQAEIARCVETSGLFELSLQAGALQVREVEPAPGSTSTECVQRSLASRFDSAATFSPAALWLRRSAVLDTYHGRGSVSKAAIRDVIDSHIGEVRSCYERTVLAYANRSARVVVKFALNSAGGVFAIQVLAGDSPLHNLHCCMLRAIARWQFPAPDGGGIVIVTYPFVFQSG
jgi:hypothetical protein